MPVVKSFITVPYNASAAEALWYDVSRWVSFIDGFDALVKIEGDWPATGARVVWDSTPDGRGRVVEHVARYEARVGQTIDVEDPKVTGVQSIAFAPSADATTVSLSFDYALKDAGPLGKLTDLLFIRRAMRDSLNRTLYRFALELRDDNEPV